MDDRRLSFLYESADSYTRKFGFFAFQSGIIVGRKRGTDGIPDVWAGADPTHLSRVVCRTSRLVPHLILVVFRCDSGNVLLRPEAIPSAVHPSVRVLVASLSVKLYPPPTWMVVLPTPWNRADARPRHSSMMKACPPYAKRVPRCVWRGTTSSVEMNQTDMVGVRWDVVRTLASHPRADVGFNHIDTRLRVPTNVRVPMALPTLSPIQQCRFRCILSVDGWGFPGNLDWALASGSWVVLLSRDRVGFHLRGRIRPGWDYIPVGLQNLSRTVDEVARRSDAPPPQSRDVKQINSLAPRHLLSLLHVRRR